MRIVNCFAAEARRYRKNGVANAKVKSTSLQTRSREGVNYKFIFYLRQTQNAMI
jgi:hypothetical protein